MNEHLIVVEYPKSGGSWLVSLLGDSLDMPKRDIYVSEGYDAFSVDKHPWYKNSTSLNIIAPSVIKSHELPNTPLHTMDNKTIHLVRDGRDVIVSKYFYEKDFCVSNGIYQSFDTPWEDYLQTTALDWNVFVEKWLEAGTCFFRYEDLLSNPLGTITSVLDFVQTPATDEKKRRAINKHTKEKFQKSLDDTFAHNSFVRKGIKGDWKNHFSSRDLDIFCQLARNTMQALGYSCM